MQQIIQASMRSVKTLVLSQQKVSFGLWFVLSRGFRRGQQDVFNTSRRVHLNCVFLYL